MKTKLAPLALLLTIAPLTPHAFAQSNESETLNAILVEVRALHADVRLSQTTQILLAELQLQQSAVNAATEHRDSLHSNLTSMQDQGKFLAAEIARLDDPDSEPTLDPVRKKQLADQAASLKSRLTSLKAMEVRTSNDLQDAETRLNTEQMKLRTIQSQLDEVVKKL